MDASRVIATSYMFREEKEYEKIVEKYIELGIRALRVNCTRFSNEEYFWQIEQYRKCFASNGEKVEILLDIPYPGDKERVFFSREKKFEVSKNATYEVVLKDIDIIKDKSELLYVRDDEIFSRIQVGDQLIVGDGEVQFVVVDTNGKDQAILRAENSGAFSLYENKR